MAKKLYSIDIPVFATAYIKAKSRDKALEILREQLAGNVINTSEITTLISFEVLMESKDPTHKVTLSPIMTVASWEFMQEDLNPEKVFP